MLRCQGFGSLQGLLQYGYRLLGKISQVRLRVRFLPILTDVLLVIADHISGERRIKFAA